MSFSSEGALIQPGDVVVTNQASDSAILLDNEGQFKRILYNPLNNSEQVLGVAWNHITNEVILSINGTPDRLVAISAYDGSVRDAVVNTQLNGNTYGVAVTSTGEYLAIETNIVEKFSATGSRISTGGFPTGSILTTGAQINSHSSGGFVGCGTGVDRVRIFNSSGVQQAETASGIGGTTNAYGCGELPNGNIAATWDGTTDSVVIYNSNLSAAVATFSDPSYLTSPRGLGIKSNGNILVADAGFDWIIEVDSSGNFVGVFSSGLFNDPWQILEIPEF